jgi:nucleoside-diphosphate-sugar epimerase
MDKMKPQEVLLLGCGDIGCSLGLELLRQGDRPLGVRRNIAALPAALPGLALNYSDPGSLRSLQDIAFDIAIMTPTPASFDAQGYRSGFLVPVENLLAQWRDGPARRLIYVSSTRVYGDCGGDWVDEDTPVRPDDPQGAVIAEAEQRLLESRHDVTVVRFSGIYGRQPSYLLQRLGRGEICPAEPPRYSNRIHRDDCLGFLLHLLRQASWHRLYLGSDSEPVLQRELEEWLMAALGVSPVREAQTRELGNRRCSNRRLLASGYQLRYPDYRSGYSAMITSTSMSTDFGKPAT